MVQKYAKNSDIFFLSYEKIKLSKQFADSMRWFMKTKDAKANDKVRKFSSKIAIEKLLHEYVFERSKNSFLRWIRFSSCIFF